MDSEINHLNQLLGEENSFNVASIVNTPNLGRLVFDRRNQESLFSPANNQIRNHIFPFQSPSPFRAQEYYYEDDNSHSPESDNLRHQTQNNKQISKIIQFEQTPKFKGASPQPSTILRAPKYYDEPIAPHISNKGRKNSKGLRNLSESVYKIVLNHKVTTYKEVAEQLVRMLNSGEFGEIRESQDRTKDEQNIKRRVYDALNVLISADVLKRNGKYVISDEKILAEKIKLPNKLINTKQSPQDLLDQIHKKKSELKYKREILAQFKNKKQVLEAVLKRNQKQPSPDQSKKIDFPLIGAVYENIRSNQMPTISFRNMKSTIRISNLGKISEIIGDLDLVVKVGVDLRRLENEKQFDAKEEACEQEAVVTDKIEKSPLNQLPQQSQKKKNAKKPQRKLLYSL